MRPDQLSVVVVATVIALLVIVGELLRILPYLRQADIAAPLR
jgi:hypothetical protein